jgi:hypothetical protein
MMPFRIAKLTGDRAMAAKKNAVKRKTKVLGNFDYRIELVTDSDGKKRVHIVGKNGGTIRGKGGKYVSFVRGPGVSRFKIVCTELPDNDQRTADKAWPFDCGKPEPDDWLLSFRQKLINPKKGASQLIFKYSIIVENSRPADPAIIIDKM